MEADDFCVSMYAAWRKRNSDEARARLSLAEDSAAARVRVILLRGKMRPLSNSLRDRVRNRGRNWELRYCCPQGSRACQSSSWPCRERSVVAPLSGRKNHWATTCSSWRMGTCEASN